jgi:hypothetical protein
MATDFEYQPDYNGIGDMLNAEFLIEPLRQAAEEIKMRAEALAGGEIYSKPEHPTRERGWDRRTGRYATSFKVTTRRYGGVKNDRVEATVTNDAPSAFWVEFGHRGREPYHVLKRAAFMAKGGL